jgi:hypothetical protein
MATLGRGDLLPGSPDAAAERSATVLPGGVWQLGRDTDAYTLHRGSGLATQVAAGRRLQVLETSPPGCRRQKVRLLEDGYPCWLETADLLSHGRPARPEALPRLDHASITARLPAVLAFATGAVHLPNVYLWGGTLGPDFDCSGLVQTAFSQAGIWLPRDAYLQERFCRPVAVRPGETSLLRPGDLIFFGAPRRCTHVGLHLGGGRYLHSSGLEHGRNGLGIDDLHPRNDDPVACHYRRELRGAGRVMHSHDGSPLPP